jgi:hypothetical protein
MKVVKTLTDQENLRIVSSFINEENKIVATNNERFSYVEKVLHGKADSVLGRSLRRDINNVELLCQNL